MGNQIFIAKQSFSTRLDGVPVAVHEGTTRVREGHPLLEGREHLFEPITVQYDTEEATTERGGGRERNPAKQQKSGPERYKGLKQPQLKAELDKRSIKYPNGPVKNVDLVKLLVADDES